MSRKLFAVAGALALAVSVGGWLFWTSTPEYSLSKIQDAVRTHDPALFNEYVDLKGVLGGLVDDLSESVLAEYLRSSTPQIEAPESAQAAAFVRRNRENILKEAERAVLGYVETGTLRIEGALLALADALLTADNKLFHASSAAKDIRSRYKGYTVTTEGAAAFVDILFSPRGHEETIPVRFVVKRQGSRWQVASIADPKGIRAHIDALDRKQTDVLLEKAAASVDAADYAKALALVATAREYRTDNPRQGWVEAQALYGLKRFQEAIPLLRAAALLDLFGALPWYELGVAQRLTGSPECVASLEKAAAVEGSGGRLRYGILLNLGVALHDAGRIQEGQARLEDALRCDESQAAPALLLYNSFLQEKKDLEAFRFLDKAAAAHTTGRLGALAIQAEERIALQQYAKAEQALSAVLDSGESGETLLEGLAVTINRAKLFTQRAQVRLETGDIPGAFSDFSHVADQGTFNTSPMESIRIGDDTALYTAVVGEYGDARIMLYCNNDLIWSDDANVSVAIKELFRSGEDWAVILQIYSGGTLCADVIRILYKHNGQYFLTKDIGRCQDYNVRQIQGQEGLNFELVYPAYYTPNAKAAPLVITFSDGKVFEDGKPCGLEPLYRQPGSKPFFPGIKDLVGSMAHPRDTIRKVPELAAALKDMLGDEELYQTFIAHIDIAEPITLKQSRYVVGEGCMKSACSVVGAVYVADLFTGKTYAAKYDLDEGLVFYGGDKAQSLPDFLRTWEAERTERTFVPSRVNGTKAATN